MKKKNGWLNPKTQHKKNGKLGLDHKDMYVELKRIQNHDHCDRNIARCGRNTLTSVGSWRPNAVFVFQTIRKLRAFGSKCVVRPV